MKSMKRLVSGSGAAALMVLIATASSHGSSISISASHAVQAAVTGQNSSTITNKDQSKLRQQLRARMKQIHAEVMHEGMHKAPLRETDPLEIPQYMSKELGVELNEKQELVPVNGKLADTAQPDAQALLAAEPPAPAQPAQPATTTPAAPAAAPAPVASTPVGEGPRLVFENPGHDYGVLFDTTPVTTKFVFKNAGTQKLVINAVNTGCGCTAAKLPKQEYEPGEGGEIEITYSPKGSGKQNRSITVASNDVQQPNMQLTIAANVIPLMEARPTNIQFGTVKIGESREQDLVIVSRDPNVKILGVESSRPEIVAEHMPDAKPNVLVEKELPGVAVIKVTLKDTAPVGRMLAQVKVKASAIKNEGSAPETQELTIQVLGAIQGELTYNPPMVRVPPIAPSTPFEREVVVTRVENKEFKILSAEVNNSTLPGVTVTTEPFEAGGVKGYKVKIKGTTGATAGNFRGSVLLTTDVEREKNNEIQFSGIVRAPVAAPAPPAPPAAPAEKPN